MPHKIKSPGKHVATSLSVFAKHDLLSLKLFVCHLGVGYLSDDD